MTYVMIDSSFIGKSSYLCRYCSCHMDKLRIFFKNTFSINVKKCSLTRMLTCIFCNILFYLLRQTGIQGICGSFSSTLDMSAATILDAI